MVVEVSKSEYFGKVIAVPSKSYAHRLLISASLKKGKTVIKNVGESLDVLATVNCLNSLGAKISLKKGNAIVYGIEKPNDNAILDAGESGSTLRFLLPIVCALGVKAEFQGRGRLLKRPNDKLIETLNTNGSLVEGVTTNGKLLPGVYKLDASISSQYVSGLLLALPLLDGDSELVLEGNIVSKNYIDITLEVLRLSGIKVIKTENGFKIKGNQEYRLQKVVKCENDWSSACFPLVAGAIGKKVTVQGLNLTSVQGDKTILEVLKDTGARVKLSKNKVIVFGGEKKGFSVNIEHAPDLAPVLSVLASDCNGESKIFGVERLKIKESDRIKAILETLNKAGIQASYNGEYLKIIGNEPKRADYDGFNDHRIVMSAVLLSSLAGGVSTVSDANAVDKSYPSFYKDIRRLGGKYNVKMER